MSTTANAQAYVGATISGQLSPGVYGRVDISNAPAPSLIYAQPVIIAPPAVAMPRSPIYMYVPPGHAKHWGKHCARYAACGQPVYFLKEPPRYRDGGPRRWERRDRDHDRWDHRHHHRGHDRDDDRRHRRHRHD